MLDVFEVVGEDFWEFLIIDEVCEGLYFDIVDVKFFGVCEGGVMFVVVFL